MLIFDISEADSQLSALVESVINGDEVILAKSGKPVAKIVRYSGAATPRQPGALKGQIWIADDFDSMPPGMADAFGMETSPK